MKTVRMWVEIMTGETLIEWTEEFPDDTTEKEMQQAWQDALSQYASGGFEVTK